MSDIKKILLVLVLLAVLTGVTSPAINAQATSLTMWQNLAARPEFSSLVNLAKGAGYDGVLNGAAPYTLFAPTNNAIASLPADRVQALTNDKPLLANLVKYHVVPGKVTYNDLKGMTSIKTIDGRTLPVSVKNGVVSVGGSTVHAGIDSSNGIIYPVDSVLMPPGFALPQVSRSTGLSWGWLPWLVGALILAGLAWFVLSRRGRHKAYEKTQEAARSMPEEHYKAEDTMRKVRESVSSVKEPNISDIAKNVELPLSGDSLKGLNDLIGKGTFANKQDFMSFLAKQYMQNNLGAAMAGGKEPGMSMVMDIIGKTGIAKGFMEGDVKKYLVPLLMAGFMAIYRYMTKQPAVKPV
jgi:uncharacterized surface protein with fasciclin (FAS1) repeats